MATTLRRLTPLAEKSLQMLMDKKGFSKQKAIDYALCRCIENEKDKETIKMLLEENQKTEKRLLIVRKNLLIIERETKEFLSFKTKKEAI